MSDQSNHLLTPGKEGEAFRDSVNTMDEAGKRKWVFPRKPRGKYTNYRNYVNYLMLVIFFIIPFLNINDNPILLINIIDRQFFILGNPFYPQDFFILALGAVCSLIFIMLFTVVFGRIFCGWICPQTVFMEMVFRKIEYLIEGDRNKQIKLDRQKWDAEKIKKRGLKYLVFAVVSLIITHVMFMYIVGYKETWHIIKLGPIKKLGYFVSMAGFTAAFYFVFAWFREQVCTLVCPYGRLQGVLIDKQTINVYYDFKRGEGRAKWRNGENRASAGKGDCIDCQQCIVVCPTGIDIRNGQQLECINCTACIDACDEIMDKVGLPTGLVRYATQSEIESQTKFQFTTRMRVTAVFLTLLTGFLFFLLSNRGTMEAKFIKSPGSTYLVQNGIISNAYDYTFINKSNESKKITIKVITPHNGEISFGGYSDQIILKRNQILQGHIRINFPEEAMKLNKQNIEIGVYDENGDLLDSYDTYFEGPFTYQF